ncbi:hypothetical protein ACHAXM_004965 [Skeletonema potamos]
MVVQRALRSSGSTYSGGNVIGRSSNNNHNNRISLSLKCILVIAFSISLLGIIFQFIVVQRIVGNNSSNTKNNDVSSFMRGGATRQHHDSNNNFSLQKTKTQRQEQQQQQERPIIAYAVTITGCSERHSSTKDAASLITQGAAILKHSIHLAHHHSNNNATSSSNGRSKYDYQMYAIIHPTATTCSVTPLKKLGYQILIRNTPFDKSDIQAKFLRENIDGASCCGAKEFLKLYAYTLVQHRVVVILDLDSLVLKPMDDLLDVMIMTIEKEDEKSDDEYKSLVNRLPIHHHDMNDNNGSSSSWYNNNNKRIDAFYTKDYNMINPGKEKYAGVQGGFLMVRPDEDVFAEYINLVLQGNYIEGKGWGGKYGYFYGGAQVQGICSYYFGEIHPEKGVELNRCRVNQMVDAPRFDGEDDDGEGKCRDGREQCEDCRETDLNDIFSVHFTICGKPWHCAQVSPHQTEESLCSKLHSEWFRIRRSYEESRGGGDEEGTRLLPKLEGSYRPEIYRGYCERAGEKGYLPLKI